MVEGTSFGAVPVAIALLAFVVLAVGTQRTFFGSFPGGPEAWWLWAVR